MGNKIKGDFGIKGDRPGAYVMLEIDEDWLTPGQARRMAARLLQAADVAVAKAAYSRNRRLAREHRAAKRRRDAEQLARRKLDQEMKAAGFEPATPEDPAREKFQAYGGTVPLPGPDYVRRKIESGEPCPPLSELLKPHDPSLEPCPGCGLSVADCNALSSPETARKCCPDCSHGAPT